MTLLFVLSPSSSTPPCGCGRGGRRLVIVTPAFHHWHHAADVAADDRNFGMFLSVWDRLFGTALDTEALPTAYGVPGSPLTLADYVGQLTIPFRP